MQTRTSSAPTDDEAMEEVQFRARMERVATGLSDRPTRRRKGGTGEEKEGGYRLGWMGWLVIDTLFVLGTIAVVVAWPPIQTCRGQDRTVGFYAGDTIGKCIRRGVGERLTIADQRIKMLIRGSGH